MRFRTLCVAALAALTLAALVSSQGRGNPNDWPTAHGDAQRTSWVRSDANISLEAMSQPGFRLQWKSKLDAPSRQGQVLSSGVVTPAVTLFTPISSIAGPGNTMFAVDNDTGNVFWTRRFQGSLPTPTPACPGGISGAPTRVVSLLAAPTTPGRGGGARGARAYSSAVGDPGEGVPLPATTGGRGGAGAGRAAGPAGTGAPTPPVPPAPAPRGQGAPATPPSPFPTNAAAQGSGGIWSPSGTAYVVSADGLFRRLGLASGKDVQRPARFVPAGAKFSDLIAVGDMAYTSTSGSCGGAPNGIWAINISGDPDSVVSWRTNGGDPIGSVAFSTAGTLYAAVGPGTPAAGGHANVIVALDPRTLELKDWFAQPGVVFAAAPILFHENGRDVLAVTTRDGRVFLLDAASLGGADHATPLVASASLTSGRASFGPHAPALWQERIPVPPGAGANAPSPTTTTLDGTRFLLVPVTGPVTAPGVQSNGTVSTGAILALRVTHGSLGFSIQPAWISDNIGAPLTPIVVNGVAFAVAGARNMPARLFALHGSTGKTMWQSERVMTEPVSGRSFWTGSGHVFVGTVDGTVFAFGFDMERGTPDQRP
jgi:hypothetical protein